MVRRPPSSASSNMSSGNSSNVPTRGLPFRTDESDMRLLSDLHNLHADEFVYLNQNLSKFQKKSEESWILRSFAMVRQYFLFLVGTWVKAAWACTFYPTSKSSQRTSCPI